MLRWIANLLIFAVLCGCGCRSSTVGGPAERILVTVTLSGELAVEGDTQPAQKARKLLRSHGGHPPDTEILLSISEKSSPADLAPAIAAIHAAGYSKIILVKPRRGSASVSERPARGR